MKHHKRLMRISHKTKPTRFKASTELLALIELLNLLPPDLEDFLQNISYLREKNTDEKEIRKTFKEFFNNLHIKLRKYLFSRGGDRWYWGELLLYELSSDKEFLKLVVEESAYKKLPESTKEFLRKSYLVTRMGFDIETKIFAQWYLRKGKGVFTRPTINKEGFLELKNSGLFAAIQEHSIEADRIRICPICERLFWARRRNQEWCSKKCSNTHFQREVRSSSERLNKINERRRANYRYKQNSLPKG
jgi:hypothetical protein